jgi:hypothetical protein
MAGSCEHGNEPSVSVEDWEFLDKLSDYGLSNELCSMELVSE